MPDLTTVEELRDYLGSRESESDALLSSILDGVEVAAERYTGGRFHPFPTLVDGADTAPVESITIPLRGTATVIRVPDIRSLTSLSLDGSDFAADEYDFMGAFSASSPATHIRIPSRAVANPY